MKKRDYHVSIVANVPSQEVFKHVNNVSKWWTETLEGNSEKLNDEFTVRFGDVHVSTQKLIEFIPGKKVVWLVTDSRLNFVKDKSEWTGTKISFEISEKGGKTHVRFSHHGLVPTYECFKDCSNAWSQYIQQSLLSLITTGEGCPTRREGSAKTLKK